MVEQELFLKSWNKLLHREEIEENPYATQCVIPLGTLRHPSEYKNKEEIPDEEILKIRFPARNVPFLNRPPFNILILGSSGDGKSKLIKLIWQVLADAGYYCLYIDGKSADCGRAKVKWDNPKSPPLLRPKGIKLRHYAPAFAIKRFDKNLLHNFHIYSLRLSEINEKEMWMGLGIPKIGSFKITKIIEQYGENTTLSVIRAGLINMIEEKELRIQSLDSAYSVLIDFEEFGFVDKKYKGLDILKDFEEGFSVCISYNSCSYVFMSFDIGEKISRCSKFSEEYGNNVPIVFFLDDSGLYAEEKTSLTKFNFAIEEIKNIGNIYRSRGLCNVMAVQSLNIIDIKVAETYPIKIITPKFAYPQSLKKINIPDQVIMWLENNMLMQDYDNYAFQFVLINEKNEVFPFFPFNPSCNHFSPVYFPK